jgi:hypothetical protein
LPREEQVLCQQAVARNYNSKSMKARQLAEAKRYSGCGTARVAYKISQNLGGLLRCLGADRSCESLIGDEFSRAKLQYRYTF